MPKPVAGVELDRFALLVLDDHELEDALNPGGYVMTVRDGKVVTEYGFNATLYQSQLEARMVEAEKERLSRKTHKEPVEGIPDLFRQTDPLPDPDCAEPRPRPSPEQLAEIERRIEENETKRMLEVFQGIDDYATH